MRATIIVPQTDSEGQEVPPDAFAWWECRLGLDFRAFTRVSGTRMFLEGPDETLNEISALMYTVESKEEESPEKFTREVRYHLALAEVEFGVGRVFGTIHPEDTEVRPDREARREVQQT